MKSCDLFRSSNSSRFGRSMLCAFAVIAAVVPAAGEDGYSLLSIGPELENHVGVEWSDLSFEFVQMSAGFDLNDFSTWNTGLAAMPESAGYFSNDQSNLWSVSFVVPSNAEPLTVGSNVLLWGYNSKDVVPGSEWILLSDPLWELAAVGPTPSIFSFNFSEDTSALFGAFEWGDSASGSLAATAAIPEPSTYAALFGLATLLIVGFRRFRVGRAS